MSVRQKCSIHILSLKHYLNHIPDAILHPRWSLDRKLNTCFHVTLDILHILAKIRQQLTPLTDLPERENKALQRIIGSTLGLRTHLSNIVSYTAADIEAVKTFYNAICQAIQELDHDKSYLVTPPTPTKTEDPSQNSQPNQSEDPSQTPPKKRT